MEEKSKKFVIVKDKRYYVKYNSLNLSYKQIEKISDIRGLETLTSLKKLYLVVECQTCLLQIRNMKN